MSAETKQNGDAECIRRVIAGDPDAFAPLLNRYKDQVLRVVLRHVPPAQAEETVQETFVRAYRSLASFRGKSSFKSWLSSIAVRTCYDYWRRAYRSRETSMSSLTRAQQDWLEATLTDDSRTSYEDSIRRREAKETLAWALGQMSPEDRMVLELVYLQGKSGKEAARLLGWSLANVKVRSFRSRKKLEKLLLASVKTEKE